MLLFPLHPPGSLSISPLPLWRPLSKNLNLYISQLLPLLPPVLKPHFVSPCGR